MLFLQYKLFFVIVILINSINVSIVNTEWENEEDIQTLKPIDHTDMFQLNVGGEIMTTTRETLMKIPESTLSILFNGQWEDILSKDQGGSIFFDFNPILFRYLLDQLQILEINDSVQLYPPSQPSLVEPFKKMIKKLGLQQSLLSEKKNVITFNVGGQTMTSQRTRFTEVSNSTFDTIVPPSKTLNLNNESDVFVDYDPKLFQHLIKQLRRQSFKNISYPELSLDEEKLSFRKMLNDFSIHLMAVGTEVNTVAQRFPACDPPCQTNGHVPTCCFNHKYSGGGYCKNGLAYCE